MSEVKDQLFQAIESGDSEMAFRLVTLFPHLVNEEVFGYTPIKFAARHGQAQIMRFLKMPYDESSLKELLNLACIDGHREAIALIVAELGRNVPEFSFQDISSPYYSELLSLLPDGAKQAVLFPYIWKNIRGLLYLNSKGKLGELFPVHRTAKFLY